MRKIFADRALRGGHRAYRGRFEISVLNCQPLGPAEARYRRAVHSAQVAGREVRGREKAVTGLAS